MADPKNKATAMTAVIDRRVETPPGGVKLPKPPTSAGLPWLLLTVAFLAGVLVTLLAVWALSSPKDAARPVEMAAVAAPQPVPVPTPVAKVDPAVEPGSVESCEGRCWFSGTLTKSLGSLPAGTRFTGAFMWPQTQAPGRVVDPHTEDHQLGMFVLAMGAARFTSTGGVLRVTNDGADGATAYDGVSAFPSGVEAKFGGVTLDPNGVLLSLRMLTTEGLESTRPPAALSVAQIKTSGESMIEFRVAGETSGTVGTIEHLSGRPIDEP